MVEVDLSNLYVNPCKEMKKEIKRIKKRANKDKGEESDPEEEQKDGLSKNSMDEESKPNSTPQVIGMDVAKKTPASPEEQKKPTGFMHRVLDRVSVIGRPSKPLKEESSISKAAIQELNKPSPSKVNKSKYLSSGSSGESVSSSSDSDDSSSSTDEKYKKPSPGKQKAKKAISKVPLEETAAK
jgi:hypothetical protein